MGMREDFLRLPPQEQHSVLLQANPDYASLPDKEKSKIIGMVNKGYIDIESVINTPQQSVAFTYKPQTWADKANTDFENFNKKGDVLQKAITRPLIETAGMVGGGLIGAAAGGWGAPIGAGLGYAGATRLADLVLGENKPIGEDIRALPKDLAIGAAGELIAPVIKAAVKAPGAIYRAGKKIFSSNAAQAGKTLIEKQAVGEPYLSNIKSAEKIQEQVPDLNLTYGQKSDFPPAVRAEAASARSTDIGAVLFKNLEAGNQAALKGYIKNKFPEQGNIDEVLNIIKPQIDKLRVTKKLTRETIDNTLADMPNITRESIQEGGKTLRGQLSEAKTAVWKQSTKLYSKIDDVPVDSSNLLTGLKDYEASVLARGEASNSLPTQIINQLEKTAKIEGAAIKGGKIVYAQTSNFNLLRGLRGQAYSIASNTTDYQLANNARQIAKIIDDNMNVEAEKLGGDVWENFRAAQDFYNKEYVGKFRLGTVGNVLKKGKDAQSRFNKTDSEVIGEFFRGDKKGLERIQDLSNALGKEQTQGLIRDYAIYDLKNTVLNKSTGMVIPQKIAGWFARHGEILKNAGIDKEFKSLANVQKILDTTSSGITNFEQSIAGKMLGVEPQFAIETAFKGKSGKDSGIKAAELMRLVGGNKPAIAGLQNSFKDFLIKSVENTAEDVAGGAMLSSAKAQKVISQYMPAIRTLWKHEPEKIKALTVFQEATKILNRTKTSQFAGAQTSEYQKAMQTMERLPFMGYTGVALRFLIRVQDFMGKQKVEQILAHAQFDPNYADDLMRIARQTYKNGDMSRAFALVGNKVVPASSLVPSTPPNITGRVVGAEAITGVKDAAKETK